MPKSNIALTRATIKAIEAVIAKGDRAVIIPVKDGIRVKRDKSETVYEQTTSE